MTRSGTATDRKDGKVAIIGMGCLFPGAPDLDSFWSNIVRGVDAIREVSDSEWRVEDYYDEKAKSFGMSYSKRAGFISEHARFDPLKFGVMPSAVAGTDPDQLLTLRVAFDAMSDAGYLDRPLDGDRAEIILGRISAPGAGSMNLIHQSKTVHEIAAIVRSLMPEQDESVTSAIASQLKERLAPCSSDTIPGAMPNVLAGRIANKLGFRGRNLLIDAACASSMVAIETAVNDLLAGHCDFALAGGLHVNSSNVFFQMFCGLGALSRTDTIRPFDESADGTLLGEGIGIVCLKRLEDAIADGDKIYATICGVASSSDGHSGSVLSPSLDGEALAMQKAYEMAGISPRTVELLEAHGTATPAGDVVEMKAVAKVFNGSASGASGSGTGIDESKSLEKTEPAQWCAVGSVKSMIGHCQSASAVAGIIKAALALHHKILPPTLNVERPNSKIDWASHPCYINSEARPWLKSQQTQHPRRAAISAFGFGGINGHMILEEHREAAGRDNRESAGSKSSAIVSSHESVNLQQWDSEVFTFRSYIKDEIVNSLQQLSRHLELNPDVVLKDLAYSVNRTRLEPQANSSKEFRLAIVASDRGDLLNKVKRSIELIEQKDSFDEPEKGLYYSSPGTAIDGKLAFLYPGLGSAYTGMLAELCLHFPEVREVFEICDSIAIAAGAETPPSHFIFPRRVSAGRVISESLASADFAVVAVLLAEYALYQLLKHLEVAPDAVMGCSTGEFAAITTGGAVDVLAEAKKFYGWSVNVARSITTETEAADLCSVRILSSSSKVMALANEDVYLNSDLGDNHIIVTGRKPGIEALCEELKKQRIAWQVLPIAIPYHTPLAVGMIDKNHDDVTSVDIQPLAVPAWSCSIADVYPPDTASMRAAFTELFSKPVLLRQTIDAMYESGIRKFVEVGPNGILTTVIAGILKDRPHIAVASNLASRSALTQINNLLASLFVNGVSANFGFLYMRRKPSPVDWKSNTTASRKPGGQLLDLRHTKLEIDAKDIPIRAVIDSLDTVREPLITAGHDETQNRVSRVDADEQIEEQIDETAEVMQSYLKTNATFYDSVVSVQERVMKAFLAGESALEGSGFDLTCEAYEFGKRFQVASNHDVTSVLLPVDLSRDLYLLDHAIGGPINTMPEQKVFLMPLMVSLEIMAEAAIAGRHGKAGVIVRVEQVKAFKRLVVDRDGIILKMNATESGDTVHVEMFDDEASSNPVLLADFIFGAGYPSTAQPELQVVGQAPSNLRQRADLYRPSAMFHGPRMQSVISLDLVGNRSIFGTASADAALGWMPDVPSARFALHPLLLDNASQFVLFYLYEKGLAAKALLPFFIESIEFFGSPEDISGNVFASGVLSTISEKSTEAKVEILRADRSVLARINNISSKRITLSERWIAYVNDPISEYVGQVVPMKNGMKSQAVISQVERNELPQDDTTLDWCLDYLLTRTERAYWRQNLKFEKRKLDWLIGRVAAKEAIKRLLSEQLGVKLGPLDIEIQVDDSKRPIVRTPLNRDILVSISHTSGIGFAMAALADKGSPGIDAEEIVERDSDFPERFLNASELQSLESCSGKVRNVELTRLWTAKEAVFKALGGSIEMTSLRLENFEVHSDVLDQLVISYTLA